MTDVEWAYAAGFIDGEGSILIAVTHKQAQRMTPRISLGSSDLEVLMWLRERFGGSIHARAQHVNLKIYAWQLSARLAETFIKGCLPHLIVKKREAEMVLKFYSEMPADQTVGRGRKMLPNEITRRVILLDDLRALRKNKYIERGDKIVAPKIRKEG